MADQPSTLTSWRIGGQLDPAWLADVAGLVGRTWESVRATSTLNLGAGNELAVDPSNGAHIHPLQVAETIDRAAADGQPSDGQWRTPLLKPTRAVDPDQALQPVGVTWSVTVSVLPQGATTFVDVTSYAFELDADRDYTCRGRDDHRRRRDLRRHQRSD